MPTATPGRSRVWPANTHGSSVPRYLVTLTRFRARRYKEALAVALKELPPCCTTRLGLALNLSVFQYEIEQKPAEARQLASQVRAHVHSCSVER